MSTDEAYETIVIGGGQAGLAAGYFLNQKGKRFAILDENKQAGEAWRQRWDSLRLFTPSKFNGLPGMPWTTPDYYFPTKDEVAGYLEEYSRKFHMPVQHGVKVESLERDGDSYEITTGAGSLRARNVIVATGPYQKPHTPSFAAELDPAILQLHSNKYCNPQQILAQNILVVGAGNSGAEIGMDLARAGKHVWLAGRDVGRIPADSLGRVLGGQPYWWFISRVLSVGTPVGRKARSKMLYSGTPLIRLNRKAVADAGIELTPRISGIANGKPRLDSGRSLPAEAVIWATGFRPDYRWIHLPVFDERGYPKQQRGIVQDAPGLYFLGLHFQTSLSSAFLGGVGKDAEYIINRLP